MDLTTLDIGKTTPDNFEQVRVLIDCELEEVSGGVATVFGGYQMAG
jgi:hypothetical protein